MEQEDSFFWSALGFTFGSMLLVFGAILHNTYRYGTNYNTALHVHLSGGFVMVAGITFAFLGLVGMISVIIANER